MAKTLVKPRHKCLFHILPSLSAGNRTVRNLNVTDKFGSFAHLQSQIHNFWMPLWQTAGIIELPA
jgi:hypothetical protein